jgi:NAD-dependent SIR2 family protein deacetylase
MDRFLDDLRSSSSRPIALFFGAGASKTFGYPITRDLMLKVFEGLINDEILEQSYKGPGAKSDDPRTELLSFLQALIPIEQYKKKNVPMVTSVLSLLDFSLATGQALLPGRTLDETRRVRQLLDRALLECIPDYEWFSATEEKRFNDFIDWLGDLMRHRPPGGMGFITTNYDMLSDVAAMFVADVEGSLSKWSAADVAQKVDFGFRWIRPDREQEEIMSRPAHPRVVLYKLHGSTNWLRCPLCENLYINPDTPVAWIAGEAESDADNQCHCSETRLEAQIVSPSFVREMREPNLIAIWKSALDFLRDAEHWVIVGYSFPDEDVAIRALFTRAFGSRNPQPKITVIQLDDSARINYESFFPAHSVQYLTGGLGLLLRRWQATKRRPSRARRR